VTTDTIPRFESTELSNGVRVCFHRTPKLKTIFTRAFFTTDLDEHVTKRALVPMLLRRGTSRLPDMQKLSRRREELYACQLYSSPSKLGEWNVVRFTLDVVNDEFLPGVTGVFEDGVSLMHDLIYDPLVESDGFRTDYLDQERENLRLSIESIIDNKDHYAGVRCVEEMCANEPYRRHEYGHAADLPDLTASQLLEFHRDWTARAPLSIYVAGDIDEKRVIDAIARSFDGARGDLYDLNPVPEAVTVDEPRVIEEKLDVNQGKLVMGFRHDVRYGSDDYEALVMMCTVLGGGGNSRAKLFQNVREKESLCYYAYASVNRIKGLLFISSGINVENYEKTRDLCLAQLAAVQSGEISDEEIDSAREMILESNRMLEDDLSSIAEADFARRQCGQELDLRKFRERISSVTRDEIVEVAKRVSLDLTYFLRN